MELPKRNFDRFYKKLLTQPFYAISVAMKRMRAYNAYDDGTGVAPMPEAVTFFLTHRCNLKCKMCGQWGESGVTRHLPSNVISQEMNYADYSDIIENIAPFKPSVTLFGGEPLLHPGCISIIRDIKRHNLHALMITNGSMLGQFIKPIMESGLDELNVSIDGSQAIHDEIRGMPGLFKNITDGIMRISAAKEAAASKKPLINIQCTITAYNYRHLSDLIKVAKLCRANSLTFHNLIFLTEDIYKKQLEIDAQLGSSSTAWEGFISSPKFNPDEIYNTVQALIAANPKMNIDIYPNFSKEGLKEYYSNPSADPKEYPARCVSPWITAYVFPDGSVRPCLNSTYSFGNVKEQPFSKVWNSPQAITFRKALLKNKMFPVCGRCTELYRY